MRCLKWISMLTILTMLFAMLPATVAEDEIVVDPVEVDGEALDEPYINEITREPEGFQGPLTVPEGYVFVMGDNRNRSTDSRDARVGLIREDYLLGRALFRVSPFGKFKIG